MVNLKEHYKKISEKEQVFLKEIPKLLNFVNNKDPNLQKSFIQKTVLSIKEIFKEEEINPKNKYYCLQFLNICMEQKSEIFIDCFAQHMYDYLIQLVQNTPDKKSEKNMARYLFSSKDPEDQNYSQKFFYLLLELFEYWGTQRPFKNNEKYQQFKILKNEGIQFPRKDSYRYKYLQQGNQDQQQNNSFKLDKQFDKLEDNFVELQDILRDDTFHADDFKSTMKEFVIDFKNILDYKQQFNRKQEDKFKIYDQFMELYMENSDDLRKFKKQYSNFNKKQNPFQEKDFNSIENSDDNNPPEKKKQKDVNYDMKSDKQIESSQSQLEEFENYIKSTRKKALDRINELKRSIQKQQESNLKIQEQIYGTDLKLKIAQEQLDQYQEFNEFHQNQQKLFEVELSKNLNQQKPKFKNNFQGSLRKQNTYYQTQLDKQLPSESFQLQSNSLQKINHSFQYQNQSLHEPKNYQNIESLRNDIAQHSDFLNSLDQEIKGLLNRKKNYPNINKNSEVIPNRSQSLTPNQDIKDRIASKNFKNSYYQNPQQLNKFSQSKLYSQYSNSKRNNFQKDERLSHLIQYRYIQIQTIALSIIIMA